MTDRFTLERSFRFEAAHHLPATEPDHPCHRVHGHSYEVIVAIEGELDEDRGWVVDFAAIDEATRPLIGQLDHRLLNDVEGLENPTSENLCRWVWRGLAALLPGLAEVSIRETPRSVCRYRGASH